MTDHAPNTVPPSARAAIGTASAPGRPDPALELHLWRRLDWRFLLPTSRLGAVGYAGEIDEELKSACRLVDPDAADVTGTDPPSPRTTVVLRQPSRAQLTAAVRRLAPGGSLYLETRQSWRPGGPRTLRGWRRLVKRHGLVGVTTYWHTPDLDSCSRITPLDSRQAVRLTLDRHRGIRFGAVKAWLGRVLLSMGLIELAVPAGSIVARRPDEPVGRR